MPLATAHRVGGWSSLRSLTADVHVGVISGAVWRHWVPAGDDRDAVRVTIRAAGCQRGRHGHSSRHSTVGIVRRRCPCATLLRRVTSRLLPLLGWLYEYACILHRTCHDRKKSAAPSEHTDRYRTWGDSRVPPVRRDLLTTCRLRRRVYRLELGPAGVICCRDLADDIDDSPVSDAGRSDRLSAALFFTTTGGSTLR